MNQDRPLTKPRQARSQKSLDDLVSAAETLLRDRPFDAISVGEICRVAGLTTGALYARLPGKDALMPLLYDRYHEWLAREGPARFGRVDWDGLDLDAAGEQIGRLLIGFYEERPWLLRAATLFSRADSGKWPSGRASSVVPDGISAALSGHLKAGQEDAVRFVAFGAMSVAREAVLFGNAPAASTAVDRKRLARDIGRLISGFLRASGATRESGSK